MVNKIKHFLCLAVFLLLVACTTATWGTIGTNGTMFEHAVETYNNEVSLDSICQAENLPSLSQWKKLDTRSGSGNVFSQYVYAVQTDSTETVYIVTFINKSNEFNFVKREVK